MTSTDTTQAVHPFERAGLGRAPFRFIGVNAGVDVAYGEVILNRAEYERTGIRLSTKRGGTCAFCGQGILDLYTVEDSEKRRFHVGCDCIKKVGDDRLVRSVAAAKRKVDRVKRAKRAKAVEATLADFVEANRDALIALPHPNAYMAAKGETLLSWAEFMIAKAGATGRAKALKTIKAALA